MRMENLVFRTTRRQVEDAQAIARKAGLTQSQVLRLAVAAGLPLVASVAGARSLRDVERALKNDQNR